MRLHAISLQIYILILGLSGSIYATTARPAPPVALYIPPSSPSPSQTPLPSASQSDSAIPQAITLQARNERHSSRSVTRSTTTDDKTGKTVTINVTTIVIIRPSPDPNKIIHDGNTYARQQQTKNTTETQMSDPNDAAIARQLLEDQAALRRMVTILSVVGGVGAIAVVATLIVFTRMRRRKRKQREYEYEEDERRRSGHYNNTGPSMTDTQALRTNSTRRPPNADKNNCSTESNQGNNNEDDDDDDLDDQYMPAPSAPPAPPFLATLDQSAYDPFRRRRHVISMVSQTAPAPSAPTPKELDAMVDDASNRAEGSSSVMDKPQYPVQTCAHCSHHHRSIPLEPPEAPPPAYTPSAPPLYEYPLLQTSSAPSSSSSSRPADETRQTF